MEGLLYHRQKAGVDDVPLEVRGDAQDKPGVLQGNGLGVSKPGINGDGGHIRLHQSFNFIPDIGSGFHELAPSFSDSVLSLSIIAKKRLRDKAFQGECPEILYINVEN